MSHAVRCLVVAVLLAFAYRGAVLNVVWPPRGVDTTVSPRPEKEWLEDADDVVKILPKMLPGDRQHLSAFYDAMAYVLVRDGERAEPLISTTEKFAAFHAGSLNLAIEKKKVGKYPGLDKAIDMTLMRIAGAEEAAVDKEKRDALVAACGVLAWVFAVNHE